MRLDPALRTAIVDGSGIISGNAFEEYKDELRNTTMHQVSDTSHGDKSIARINFFDMTKKYANAVLLVNGHFKTSNNSKSVGFGERLRYSF